ncbi:MFS transporter [Paenibacillus chartarius]|uniref:MFS transporter n=1 Tax=Paenibacillus chartarius TaxID=747481 RepID=A0ABV6DR85_9BACL
MTTSSNTAKAGLTQTAAGPAIPEPAVRTGLSKPMVTFTFLLGIFMGALDHGIVGPALSSIMAAYAVDATWGVWSFTMYTLLFAVSIPILGKLSDRFGRKRTFMFGISMFALGSLLAAFAPSFGWFLAGRAVQAVGTGGIFPITAAQIAVSYPPERRGRMMGLIGTVFGVGTILGPIIGGLLISQLAWQWIFLVNVPISIVIIALIATYRQAQAPVKKPIDLPGIALLTAALISIMYGITAKNITVAAIGLLFAAGLVLVERKAADPVMNVRYFTRANSLILLLASMASGFVMASATNMMPYFTEKVLGLAAGSSGYMVAPLAAASMAASLAGGVLVDRISARRVLELGFVISAIGALCLAFLVSSAAALIPVLVVLGFGIGIITGAPLNMLMLQTVEPKETGAAVGYVSLFRSLGSTMGPTVAGVLAAAFAEGFTVLFAASAAVSAVSLALVLIGLRKRTPAA